MHRYSGAAREVGDKRRRPHSTIAVRVPQQQIAVRQRRRFDGHYETVDAIVQLTDRADRLAHESLRSGEDVRPSYNHSTDMVLVDALIDMQICMMATECVEAKAGEVFPAWRAMPTQWDKGERAARSKADRSSRTCVFGKNWSKYKQAVTRRRDPAKNGRPGNAVPLIALDPCHLQFGRGLRRRQLATIDLQRSPSPSPEVRRSLSNARTLAPRNPATDSAARISAIRSAAAVAPVQSPWSITA